MVRPDVVEAERLDGRWCRLPERRIVRREQRSFERSLREVLRALQPAGKLRHERRAHRAEGLLGQAGMDHVISQEGDGRREVLVEDAHGKVRRRPLLRTDLVERSLEREPVERGRSVAEEPVQDLVHSLLSG